MRVVRRWRGLWSRRFLSSLTTAEQTDKFQAPTVDGFFPRFDDDADHRFTAATYNVLAPCYALHPEVGNCPIEVLDWNFRRGKILGEIERLDTDLLCLQEVEREIFERDLEPWLQRHGYEGIFFCKRPQLHDGFEEGVALMYKTAAFLQLASVCAPFQQFLEYGGQGLFFRRIKSLRDGFAAGLLQHRPSGKEVLAAGVHLYEERKWPDARVAQCHALCETISTVLVQQARPQDMPVVLLGGFSSFWKKWTTDDCDKRVDDRCIVSGPYTLLTEGSLDYTHCHHPCARNHYGAIKDEDSRKQNLKSLKFTTSGFLFESAYHRIHGMEPPVTKWTADDQGVFDYVFYTPKSVDTVSTLRLPYEAHPVVLPQHVKLRPMPNVLFPSNHIPIGATLVLKK